MKTATRLAERITGEFEDVEGVADFHGIGRLLGRRGLETGEPVNEENVDTFAPFSLSGSQ
ncbi:hypothetical protein BKA07_002117 [Brevibacterium marinum]|uniref:Uncharacterized protein n=1 Tax=Brevibacterium marinum TaxID=418643 RepID=A0A846S6L7_9MICO|nr:hypothetical protein [Brevibacterium marinum]